MVEILSVLVGSQHSVNLEGGCVEHLDVVFAQDTLDVVGGTRYNYVLVRGE